MRCRKILPQRDYGLLVNKEKSDCLDKKERKKRMVQKILVVDSEGLIAEVCQTALGAFGHEIVCTDERQAVSRGTDEAFDLIIINIVQGKKSGIEIYQKIRKLHPGLHGVLLSDKDDLERIVGASGLGLCRVCKKPINIGHLAEVVTEIGEIARLRDDFTRMKILLPLYTLGKKFIAAESEQDIYEELVETVSREMNVPSVSVMMFDDKTDRLKVVACRGLDFIHLDKVQIKAGDRIAGKVFQSQKPIVINRSNQHLSPYPELLDREELSASISFPVISRKKVVGVVNVSETKDEVQFHDADIEMLSIIVDQAMMAVENVCVNREREENSRIRSQLEQYVSPEVTKMLMRSNQDPLDVGSVQELTVLFADIRNSTLLVQHLEPDLLRLFLNSFFEMFGNIVFSFEGMLDKFMGDAALVIFGAPVRIDNPNLVAVSAANKIMIEFEKLRVIWEKKNPTFAKVGLGIGLSRGPMFLGNVGSSKRLDYTVIGTDVNIAQRLASVTISGQILLTDRVEETLGRQFSLRTQRNMLLKGMEEEVTVYALAVSTNEKDNEL